jgi:hypothetical protein
LSPLLLCDFIIAETTSFVKLFFCASPSFFYLKKVGFFLAHSAKKRKNELLFMGFLREANFADF